MEEKIKKEIQEIENKMAIALSHITGSNKDFKNNGRCQLYGRCEDMIENCLSKTQCIEYESVKKQKYFVTYKNKMEFFI
jgi:predicted PP-loop superfamily ATPase